MSMPKRQNSSKIINLESMIPENHYKDLTEEEYFEEVKRIVKCNEEVNVEEVIGEKEIIVSNTDSDAGILYKSDKEKMFSYNTSVICNNNNYVLTVDTNPSNMHNSVAFYSSLDNFINNYDISKTKYFVGDAAYLTNHICKTIIDLEIYLHYLIVD